MNLLLAWITSQGVLKLAELNDKLYILLNIVECNIVSDFHCLFLYYAVHVLKICNVFMCLTKNMYM